MKKVAIITGASQGIGRQIAITLAEQGIQVIANYNKSEKEAIKLKEQMKEQNIEIDIIKADVTSRNEVKKMIKYVLEKYKKIDVLINNAGIDQEKLFQDITDEDWNRVINTNLYSAFIVTQEVLPNMIHNKNGCIINISSIWGIVGASLEVLYSISKAGLDAMTKALAKELGPSNIRINSIAPGFIKTKINEKFSEKEIESITQEIPLERIGNTEDIAKCVNWLIEDNYTTGQVISINGGWVI